MPEHFAKHPTNQELTAYSMGQLAPETERLVEQHVQACDPCCETIANLSSQDTFVDLLQQAGQTSDNLPADNTKPIDELPPESLLNHPRYEVERLVGRGGMGRVFQARHRMMICAVA